MIYLSQKDHLKNTFFLRILKEPDQQAIEFDAHKKIRFSPNKGGTLPSGEPLDLLEIWIKPLDSFYPSVLLSETPIKPQISSSSKTVKIKLINVQTNQVRQEVDFFYEKAPIENHMDIWSIKQPI